MQGMTLTYQTKGSSEKKECRVVFDPPLAGYEEVKPRLMSMKGEAEEQLGMVRRTSFWPWVLVLTSTRLSCRSPRPRSHLSVGATSTSRRSWRCRTSSTRRSRPPWRPPNTHPYSSPETSSSRTCHLRPPTSAGAWLPSSTDSRGSMFCTCAGSTVLALSWGVCISLSLTFAILALTFISGAIPDHNADAWLPRHLCHACTSARSADRQHHEREIARFWFGHIVVAMSVIS